MRVRHARSPLLLVGALGAALALAGCGGGNGNSDQGNVRVLNLFLPTAGPTSMQLTSGGTSFGPLVSYGAAGVWPSSGYFGMTPAVFAPSTTIGSTTLSGSQNLVKGSYYTLLSTGGEAQTGTFTPALLFIPAYNTSVNPVIGSGQVAIRMVDLSPDPDSVAFGLYNAPPGGTPTPVVEGLRNVPYGYSSTAAGNQWYVVPVSSLTNLLIVEVSDPTETFTFTSPSNLNTFTFTAGQAYTLYLYGSDETAGDATFKAVWVREQVASWVQ